MMTGTRIASGILLAMAVRAPSRVPAVSSVSAFTSVIQRTQRTNHLNLRKWNRSNSHSPKTISRDEAAVAATPPQYFLQSRTHRAPIQLQSTAAINNKSVSYLSLALPLPLTNIIRTLFPLSSNSVPLLPSLMLNMFLFFSLRTKLDTMLTREGIYHSLFLGTLLWATLGWRGWTTCVLYLFLGQLVTRVGFAKKEALGIAEGRGGRRGPENVWGSALTGSLCAIAGRVQLFGLNRSIWLLGYVASLATKLADTFASEIGKVSKPTRRTLIFCITICRP